MSFSRPIQWYHSHADPIWPFLPFVYFMYVSDSTGQVEASQQAKSLVYFSYSYSMTNTDPDNRLRALSLETKNKNMYNIKIVPKSGDGLILRLVFNLLRFINLFTYSLHKG